MFSALIIDADGKTPATLKSILAPYGFEFTVTENGPEAVNVARQAAPDIILLRAELPLTTGFSVCNRLRRNEDTRKIPLILYSSNASDDVIDQHRNLKTHADQYLRLPLDNDRLVGAVKAFLNLPDPRSSGVSARPAAASRPDSELASSSPSLIMSRVSRAEMDCRINVAAARGPAPARSSPARRRAARGRRVEGAGALAGSDVDRELVGAAARAWITGLAEDADAGRRDVA